jgi:hypothetical protein
MSTLSHRDQPPRKLSTANDLRSIPGIGSIISSGPLVDICLAVNRAVRARNGVTNSCILAAATARDVLLAKGWKADVLRVEAVVSPRDRSQSAKVLGGDGNGKSTAGRGKWEGHLVAIAEDKWLLDPTLDQTGLAPPMVIGFPDWWLRGKRLIFVPIANGRVRYEAFPGRGGYKTAPEFQLYQRQEIVRTIVEQLGASGGPADCSGAPPSN